MPANPPPADLARCALRRECPDARRCLRARDLPDGARGSFVAPPWVGAGCGAFVPDPAVPEVLGG